MTRRVYWSGEIHTDWSERIINGAAARDLTVEFTFAVTNHEASDAAGDRQGAGRLPARGRGVTARAGAKWFAGRPQSLYDLGLTSLVREEL